MRRFRTKRSAYKYIKDVEIFKRRFGNNESFSSLLSSFEKLDKSNERKWNYWNDLIADYVDIYSNDLIIHGYQFKIDIGKYIKLQWGKI